ncbi:hypothetical protein [Kangiella sp.]|uniref:hypothetical protein n=1 Tax=Kangiella sp. TaxID=1920245 RepID=UPI00198A66EE|nr:hypothetical protein [Kangiella sp.]MBD3652713.1 hypothetical protein [Kangiella sp.]
MEDKVIEGIVIGASGGAIAGITVYLIQYFHQKAINFIESKRIRNWLKENTSKNQWRSTRAIASWTNLSVERVQYLCSHDPKVRLSTAEKEDMWALRSKIPEPTYE